MHAHGVDRQFLLDTGSTGSRIAPEIYGLNPAILAGIVLFKPLKGKH